MYVERIREAILIRRTWPAGVVQQHVVYDGVGEMGTGRGAPHVAGPDTLSDRVMQGRVDAQSRVRHSHVAEHPGGRPD